MSEQTGIEWCDHTFNPVWGCIRVSAGCEHCYAEGFARRYGHRVWGPAANTARRTFGDGHWNEPLKWNRKAEGGRPQRVFCGSMCDFAEDHPTTAAQLPRLWALIAATPNLRWLMLTKRPERLLDVLPADWGVDGYPNVWLGTSVENDAVLSRIERLLQVPAAEHFVSCEPLLGPVSLRGPWHDYLGDPAWTTEPTHGRYCSAEHGCESGCPEPMQVQLHRLSWVIAGGESGPGARPCALDWLRSLRDQCAAAGVPFFLKQLGGHPNKRGGELAVLDGVRHVAWPEMLAGRSA